MELTSGKEALRKWEEVLGRRRLPRRRLVAASADASDDDGGDGMHGRRRQRRQQSMVSLRGDPFDCSDVTVPPISELVEREVDIWASVWRDLDSRRVRSNTQGRGDQGGQSTTRRKRKMARTRSENVQAEDVDVNHDEDNGDNRSLIDKSADRYDIKNDDDGVRKMPGRKISRWRLPDGFDVTCRSDRQIFPDVVSSSSQRGKVISLADPTKFLDYDAELYKIFSSVPVQEDIEDLATSGSICTESLTLKRQIEEGLACYSRLDGHALGRMRLRERHGLPSRVVNTKGGATGNNDPKSSPPDLKGVTVRVECWRRMAKRGSSPDCHRLEVELLGEQTLEDLHKILIELGRETLGIVTLEDGSGSLDGGRTKTFSDSGMFFIENKFYSFGEVDYSGVALDWLYGKTEHLCSRSEEDNGTDKARDTDSFNSSNHPAFELRRNYLGLGSSNPLQRPAPIPMSSIRLDSIPIRLGRRYLHVSDGDREVAVFFTDVRVIQDDPGVVGYPLLHDTWTLPSSRLDCAGCEQRPAVLVTYNNDLTDGSPTPLCEMCYRMLHYDKDGKFRPGSGGDDMRVCPLAMMASWDDTWVSSDQVDAPFLRPGTDS